MNETHFSILYEDNEIIFKKDDRFIFGCNICKTPLIKPHYYTNSDYFSSYVNTNFGYIDLCKECMQALKENTNTFMFKLKLGIL